MAYAQRLERDADAGVKEAIRVLHQGLSCLAGQISATDSHSARVAGQLTSNWEEMARRLSDMRLDLDTSRRVLDARLAASEKTTQYNSSALDHALDKIEAFARQRDMDQAENQRQASRHEQLLERLSDAILRLEQSLPEPNIGERLETVEQAIAVLTEEKKTNDSAGSLVSALEALSQRLEALEKDRASLLAELRAGACGQPTEEEPPASEPSAPQAPEFESAQAPDFEDIFAQAPPEGENFLARARMSAPVSQEESKPRYLFPAAAGLVAVLALAAVFVQDWRVQSALAAKPAPASPTFTVPDPPNSDDTQFVVAPQPGNDQTNSAAAGSATDSQASASREPAPVRFHPGRSAPSKAVTDAAKPATRAANKSIPVVDRVQRLGNQGNANALTILGLRAADGSDGVAVNFADAVKYLSQAAEKGQALAQYRLGALYEHGQGVAIDPVKAAHWYELSANQGNRKAMHNLAVAYASKKDMVDAARWFAKAAALGLPDSQFNLAILYEKGDGVPQSLADAFKWYAIAAGAGDAESATRMGLLQSHLSDADKAAATKAAASFRPLTLDRAANVAPDPGELPSG